MPNEVSDFARGSMELLKILMLTGALVGVYSIFQLWFTMSSGMLQFDYTGLDFFARGGLFHGEGYSGATSFTYLPLAVFVLSLLAVPVSVLSFTKHERKSAVSGVIIGAVTVAAVLMYIFYPVSTMWFESSNTPGSVMLTSIPLRDFLGEGVYSALIGGIFILTGGLVTLINRKIGALLKKEE